MNEDELHWQFSLRRLLVSIVFFALASSWLVLVIRFGDGTHRADWMYAWEWHLPLPVGILFGSGIGVLASVRVFRGAFYGATLGLVLAAIFGERLMDWFFF
jgi:hypothetical protein